MRYLILILLFASSVDAQVDFQRKICESAKHHISSCKKYKKPKKEKRSKIIRSVVKCRGYGRTTICREKKSFSSKN